MTGPAMIRVLPSLALTVALVVALVVATERAGAEDTLSFVRVIVPAEGVRDVPRGDGRYLPLPLPEFEESVARLGGSSNLQRPVASSARYTLTSDATGGLKGTLNFTIGQAFGGIPSELSLGRASVGRCTIRTPEGSGEAVVYGVPGGCVAVRTAGPGEYSASIRIPASGPISRFLMPLVPALTTTVDITLPGTLRPFVAGPLAASVAVEKIGEGQWRFVTGPVDVLPLVFRDASAPQPALNAWNTLTLRGRQADVTALLEPVGTWGPGKLELSVDPSMRITRVTADGQGEIPWEFHPPALSIDLPPSLVGSSGHVIVTAVAPRSTDGQWTVPLIRPLADQWAVAGTRLDVDPALAIGGIELEQCVVISEDETAGWPRVPPSESDRRDGVHGPPPARLALEHQSATALARVVVGPRTPVFDTARVTTVDISPGTVLGRVNCDVRVVSGEAFEVVGAIAPGWIIDSVEAVDFAALAAGEPTDADVGQLDWRVVRSRRASELRIGLARAATPQRSLGLRITGHRVGLPLGAEFTTAELDMVRLIGEAAGTALLEFRVGPTAVVEVEGAAMGLEPAQGRLAALTGDSPPRARIRTGERSPPVRARLVRRRPPVAADVQLALTARDERLAEAFTFTCRPVSGELDALVIHFSEPLGEGLDWTLMDPSGGTLVARPLATRGVSVDAAEEAAALGLSAGDQATIGIAESWLVELRPATTSSVTIRASRTVPLEGAVPVPLAWVEAAEQPGGIVAVRGGRGRRPEIVNRRLRELPPSVEDQDTALVELAYGSPESVASSDGLPPADVLPPAAAAGARAWAWHETTFVWCHESGHLEWHTTIDLENQGRGEVSLTVPPGVSLESVEVERERVALEPIGGREGVSVPLSLPSQRGRIVLDFRGSAQRDAKLGWWTIGAITCGIDVPVLDREVRLFVPPGLDVVGHAESRMSAPGWAERLFRSGSTDDRDRGSTETGFHGISITSATRGGVAEIQVVRRDVVVSMSVVAAVAATIVGFAVGRRSGMAAVICCVVAAGAALWCDPPWYAVPRAAWWGCLVGTWLAGCRLPTGPISGLLLTSLLIIGGAQATAQDATLPAAADPMPLRVFVTPDDSGGTALVPEQLFRRLATPMTGLPPVRVMAADIEFQPAGSRCSITLDLDADRGGSLLLDQRACDGVWVTDLHELSPGMVVTHSEGDAVARLAATVAGRHRVTLVCRPAVIRQGDVTMASICLPAAARATLQVSGIDRPGDVAATLQCERWRHDAWVPAIRSGEATFDVAGAPRVRIVRPVNSRDRLVSEFRSAVSSNDIDWFPGECRVTATFDVGGEREIVRSLVVRADPDLEPVTVGDEALPHRLGGGRWLLERPLARAGAARFTGTFRRPLAEPVGVFEPPRVWLEGVANDARTIRLRPSPQFDATVELPLGMTLVRPKLEDGATTTTMWRQDATPPAGDVWTGASQLAARVTVRRRDAKLRGTQDAVVQFDDNGVAIRLRSALEAMSAPLVEIPVELPPSAVIDRVSLVREPKEGQPAGKHDRVDIAWSRVAADRILVTVQRPQTGRFSFALDARQVIRPGDRGRVPVARVVTGGDLPLSLTCGATPPLSVALVGEPGEVLPFLADRFDIASGEPPPNYELEREPMEETAWTPERISGTRVRDENAGVNLTRVDLAIDRRGRCRGLVRFDLITPQPSLTLRLPPGIRLFDVRVDGREVTATPREGSAWELRLHDMSWPRTLVAVISGTVGGRFAEGEPIRLEPPSIDGLNSGLVLWSLETPSGFRLRVSMPSRVVGEREWREREGERHALQQEAFEAAIAAVGGGEGIRLRSFADARHEGTRPAGELAWYAAWSTGRDTDFMRTRIVAGDDGAVTLRASPVVPISVATRGLATALLITLVLGTWQVVRRFPVIGAVVLPLMHRWWWVACGVAWIAFLESSLPGWCMLVVGAWGAWPASWRWWRSPVGDPGDSTANASTRTVMPS